MEGGWRDAGSKLCATWIDRIPVLARAGDGEEEELECVMIACQPQT